MTTYATGNPVGSTSPKDLFDNAQNLDYLLVGPNQSYPDRLGVPRKSWKGMESDFQTFLANSGYETPIPYAAGLLVQRYTQLIEKDGEFYRAKRGIIPFTTAGVWATDSANLVAVGDAALRQELAAPDGSSKSGFVQVGVGAVARTSQDKQRERVSFKDFGVKSDFYTDDTAAVRLALASVPIGTTLWLDGPTRIIDGITIPEGVIVQGPAAPIMGTFPTQLDDKRFLRPGYKHLIPGACFILDGIGVATGATVREAPYTSFRYGVRVLGNNSAAQLRGVGVVMNMDVLDADGNVTTVAQDNRSDYDVGLFIQDSCLGKFDDVVVFGYWKIAGVLNYGDDPDQNTFTNGSSSGERGFVNLATGSAGFSGNNFFNWNFYANDHHKRDLVAAQWGTCALAFLSKNGYIVDGLYVHGGRINTHCDTPLILNDCNNVWFYGTVMELPDLASPGATTSKFIGNAAVDKVGFVGCRFSDNPIYGVDRLAGMIGGQITLVGGPTNFTPTSSFEIIRGGKVVRLSMSTAGPAMQLSATYNSSSAGVVLRCGATNDYEIAFDGVIKATLSPTGVWSPDVNEGKRLRHQRSSVVLAAGAIAATRSYHLVTTGTGVGADLSTISGGTLGDTLWLQAGNASEPITLKTTGGNIRIGADLVLTGFTRAYLMYDGAFWTKAS
jgi:hypothetical protein